MPEMTEPTANPPHDPAGSAAQRGAAQRGAAQRGAAQRGAAQRGAAQPCPNHPEVLDGCQPCARCGRFFCADCRVELRGRPVCAECKVEDLRDLVAGLRGLDLASIPRRFAAVFIDGMIFAVPSMILFVLAFVPLMFFAGTEASAEGEMVGTTLFMVVYVVVMGVNTVGRVIYEGIFLKKRGQTPGKIAMKIKVVTPEGHDLRGGQAWSRAILRFALDSCLSVINYIPAFFSRDKTCIHDSAAKTRVINWY